MDLNWDYLVEFLPSWLIKHAAATLLDWVQREDAKDGLKGGVGALNQDKMEKQQSEEQHTRPSCPSY